MHRFNLTMPIKKLFLCLCLVSASLQVTTAQETPPAQQSTEQSADKPTEQAIDQRFLDPTFWSCIDGRPVLDNWQFADGEVRLFKPRGGGGSIVSEPLPANFDLTWEWKIGKRTNSGLKYRVGRFGKAMFNNGYLGVEYQIIDDAPDSQGKGSTASIYDLVPPAVEKKLNPLGQWNQARVIARGNHLQHFVNGELVTTSATIGPGWEKSIALSKFYGAKHFGTPKGGDRIMLTDHGGKVSYRGFRFVGVGPADDAALADGLSSGPFLGNGMRNSWADQSSIVVWTRTTKTEGMLTAGKEFVSLSSREAAALSKQSDPEKLLSRQLPEGADLEQMIGACPGAAGRVRLTYFPAKSRNQAKSTDWVETNAEQDFTAQWKLQGLRPGVQYALVAEVQSLDADRPSAIVRGGFETAPPPSAERDVAFCVTTCHDFIRRDDGMKGHQIYPAMSKLRPNFVVHAGDIEYYDKPDPWAVTKDLMRFKWQRIFALPNNRDFYSKTTSYFIKDDHDTLKNDCWVGQTYGSVSFEEGVKLFNEEQFPSRAPRYQTVHWGKDLQIWILEGRDYRSPNDMPDGPEKSILGAEQKQWLFETLQQSKAKFKLVFSPTPIVGPDRANKRDNHANEIFAVEGQEIREFLGTLENVIVLCGDRHWQYASHNAQLDLWEFGCGPGSEKHQLGWKPGDQRPVHRFLRVKGGFLSGELRYPKGTGQPVLKLQHRTVQGDSVSEFEFGRKEQPQPSLPTDSQPTVSQQPAAQVDGPQPTASDK